MNMTTGTETMTATGTGDPPPAQARDRIAVAAGLALLVAGLLLVTIVLPAEYGLDPLGTGARLGLTEIGAAEKQAAAFAASLANDPASARAGVVPQERAFNQESVEFKVGPDGWMEYKYRLDKGEALLYSWKATSPVEFEFHAEPDGAPRGYAETYEKQTASSQATGTLTAPFSGIHGWYWKNRTGQDVTITLNTAGFYNLAHEFREGADIKNKSFD
jgi:hypothetical protein